MSHLIKLTRNKYAIVDEEDLKRLSEYSWSCNSNGYAEARIKNKLVRMHRFLACPAPGLYVDHINGNTLDNRKSNLRSVTPRENANNARKRGDKTTSKYRGVSRDAKGKWVVQFDGMRVTTVLSEDAAARIYDCLVIKYRDEHAFTNFPRENYEKVTVYTFDGIDPINLYRRNRF